MASASLDSNSEKSSSSVEKGFPGSDHRGKRKRHREENWNTPSTSSASLDSNSEKSSSSVEKGFPGSDHRGKRKRHREENWNTPSTSSASLDSNSEKSSSSVEKGFPGSDHRGKRKRHREENWNTPSTSSASLDSNSEKSSSSVEKGFPGSDHRGKRKRHREENWNTPSTYSPPPKKYCPNTIPNQNRMEKKPTALPKPVSSKPERSREEPIDNESANEDQIRSSEFVHSMSEAYAIVNDLKETHSKSKKLECFVFSKKNFAAAIVGEKGAIISFSDQSASLNIPKGALKKEQEILLFRPLDQGEIIHQQDGKPFNAFSSMIHCGPEGTSFERPVSLTFDHCAVLQKDQSLDVIRRANAASGWAEIKSEGVEVSKNEVVVEISNFSDYCAGSSSNRIQAHRCLVSVVRRIGLERLEIDIHILMYFENNRDCVQDKLSAIRNKPENTGCEIKRLCVKVDPNSGIKFQYINDPKSSPRLAEDIHVVTFKLDLEQQEQDSPRIISISQGDDAPLAILAVSETDHRLEHDIIYDHIPVQVSPESSTDVSIPCQQDIADNPRVAQVSNDQAPEEACCLAQRHGLQVRPLRLPVGTEANSLGVEQVMPSAVHGISIDAEEAVVHSDVESDDSRPMGTVANSHGVEQVMPSAVHGTSIDAEEAVVHSDVESDDSRPMGTVANSHGVEQVMPSAVHGTSIDAEETVVHSDVESDDSRPMGTVANSHGVEQVMPSAVHGTSIDAEEAVVHSDVESDDSRPMGTVANSHGVEQVMPSAVHGTSIDDEEAVVHSDVESDDSRPMGTVANSHGVEQVMPSAVNGTSIDVEEAAVHDNRGHLKNQHYISQWHASVRLDSKFRRYIAV
ncbi:uncharacterized protein LOC135496970 [Lineus longissimus]|uniref:uncharacterized protein LOC135496970 n=1 Tax=Lineus longissimus TaxID=88925 RepID=UPI00315C9DD0